MASDFVKAKYLGGDVREFPSGRRFGPGDEVVLPRGEAEASELFEVVGSSDADEYSNLTGVAPPPVDPEPAEQTAKEVIESLTPENAEQVLAEEEQGKARKSVIEAAEALLDTGDGE